MQNTQPHCRALYDYISKEPGDLSFRKGETILLHRSVNAQWLQGECGGKTGIFPTQYVQVIVPLPNQVATCRALYDFVMVNDEDEGCLSFRKDEVITVIRRVDENWAEGKLNDHIGIFPLAFVEMNNVAQALMKLSINSRPGPSRVAPPTPNAEESTPLIPTDHSGVISNCISLQPTSQNNGHHQNSNARAPAQVAVSGSESGSTLSSSTSTPSSSVTPNQSSSNNSSSSNSAPNSPPSSQPPVVNPNPFLPASPAPVQMILQTSHIANPPHGVLPTSHIVSQQQKPNVAADQSYVDTHCLWLPNQPSGEVGNFSPHPKEKRHSFSAVTTKQHSPTKSNKHSGEVANSEPPSEAQNGQLTRHGSQRHRRSGSDVSSGVTLPAGYLALYPYKPQKADELELKKGSVYLVTERCQDGWFKGTSYKTLKSGVFPGNYVTLAKPVATVQSVRGRDARGSVPTIQGPVHKTLHQQKGLKVLQTFGQMFPPELPPRASSPSARHQRSSAQSSTNSPWQVGSVSDASHSQKNVIEGPATSHASISPASSLNGKSPTGGYALGLTSTSSTSTKSATKANNIFLKLYIPRRFTLLSSLANCLIPVKEKTMRSELIKRLTAMKRSKSPTESASYSMDNPVFDDAPTLAVPDQNFRSYQLCSQHPVHLRSGSCPSQLVHVKPEGGLAGHHRITSASVSGRLKHRDRPSVSSVNFTPSTSRPLEGNTIAKTSVPSGPSSHRKSNSLDGGDTRKPKQLVPPVRERYRCIVPYPPNSEYELELKVGDIIYVHRKREDGWYKGTQQRTGKTGLFPASFVETCLP
ncbi:hypothetical protein RUM44_007696 [Polyplax serrata]|uniref:RING-type E3 ubiquitin transferase n=1 Tax=Polyplax serrata TaxID=468196 RepID=A0ABR1BA88_POLSC